MRKTDVEEAERVTGDTFHRLAERSASRQDPAPAPRTPARRSLWRECTLHLLEHDAAGCWVAEDGDAMVGAATSLRRETLWGLSTLAVLDESQGHGIGHGLLEAALTHSQGCVRGIICASPDPGAVRLYHQAGFTIHPTMRVAGTVDRAVLPVVEGVRVGVDGDTDLLDSVDRRTRGAGRGVDHAILARHQLLLVADNHLGSGYCYLAPDGGLYLLASTSERLAQRLVWEAMARSDAPDFTVGGVTGEQAWLVDLAVQARLTVRLDAYVALRFMKPPHPYVPSPHFL